MAKKYLVTSVNDVSPTNGNVSITIPTTLASLTDDATHRLVTDTEKGIWSGKQDAISDLSDIRSGASLGTTSIQPNDNVSELTNDAGYVTSSYHDSTKYDASNPSGYITSSAITGKEDTSNKVTTISSSSTDTQYPSAKAVYDYVGDQELAKYGTEVINAWKSSTIPIDCLHSNIAYGNGKFIFATCVTTRKAYYSTNGIDWTETTMPSTPGEWKTVTYGNGKFVAIQNNSDIAAYSTDGVTWTASTMPTSAYWKAATYGNGKFVAIANGSTNAAYSTDGVNWTQTTLPSSEAWSSITYGNGKFVAISMGQNTAISTDGVTWTASTMPIYSGWVSITYGKGVFVAVSNNKGCPYYSTDGTTWTASEQVILVGGLNFVTYGGGVFVFVSTGSGAGISTDGINWTASTLPTSSMAFNSIAYGNNKFVTIAEQVYDSAYLPFKSTLQDKNSNALTCIDNGLNYTTTAPTADNPDGVKIAILSSEPATKYNGWLYFIAEA